MNQVSERALRIADELSRRTTTGHYRLVLNENRVPAITSSKIGGKPYWPADQIYPTDDQGKPMLMIMQINCGEAGLKTPLPEKGMLQWFISINHELMYGCRGNFDDGNGFNIIYHESIDENNLMNNVPSHDIIEKELTPVKRETAIDFVEEDTVMNVTDGHFNRLFFEIVEEITGVNHTDKRWYQYLDNEDGLYFEQNLGMKSPRHQMLGYPFFDQDDARRTLEKHDVLLFQLASQHSAIDRKELVMWGDMGNGFVFINHEDLAKLDFSHAYYCWDCG